MEAWTGAWAVFVGLRSAPAGRKRRGPPRRRPKRPDGKHTEDLGEGLANRGGGDINQWFTTLGFTKLSQVFV